MSRILVVDDDPAIRGLLRVALSRAGHEVVLAAGAQAAMAICQFQCFDLLLSDVRMPGLNGHELAQWVSAHCPNMATVLMSGYDLECESCPYSPRCLLLHKPFRPAEAVAVVNRALKAA